MPIQVETRDSAALNDADLDEMGSMGGAFDIGALSKAKDGWVLSTTARVEGKLHGFSFATLERIGGTPCVLLGLVSVRRTSKRDQVLKGLMGEAFHRALMAFPDEDVVVGSRFVEDSDYKGTWARRLGQRLFSRLVSTSTRQQFTDTTSGMRALNQRAMSLFAARYSSEFAEVESLQQAVRAGLTVEELHVTMLPRTEGESFITPLGSAFYIFKTLIVLMVGQLRPKDTAEAKR